MNWKQLLVNNIVIILFSLLVDIVFGLLMGIPAALEIHRTTNDTGAIVIILLDACVVTTLYFFLGLYLISNQSVVGNLLSVGGLPIILFLLVLGTKEIALFFVAPIFAYISPCHINSMAPAFLPFVIPTLLAWLGIEVKRRRPFARKWLWLFAIFYLILWSIPIAFAIAQPETHPGPSHY